VKYIVSFSGGKDSTAMLLRLLEEARPVDDIVFCDTTAEFPQMYEHIEKVEKYIGRRITILRPEHDFEYMMLEYDVAARNGKEKKGKLWPNPRLRWCTGYFKQDQMRKYMKQFNEEVTQYIGIAADEKIREHKDKVKRRLVYPLVEWGMTERDCLQYCYDRGFTWGGLYEKFNRLSCYLCPMKSLNELRIIRRDFPELWKHMMELDERSIKIAGYSFRPNCTIADLTDRFEREEKETQHEQQA